MYNRIRELRKAKKLTQKAFAELLETNQQAITKYENNVIKPSELLLKRIKEKIPETNLEWLITGNGEMFIYGDNNVVGDNNRVNIHVHKEEEHTPLEKELLEAFKKLDKKRQKYYYHKILAESLEG